MITETLKAWRQELAAELSAAQSELLALETEHAMAADAVRIAERYLREAQAAVAPIRSPSSLITGRLHDLERGRGTVRGRQARAAGQLQVVRERIRELERAIGQLDQVIAPAATEEAA